MPRRRAKTIRLDWVLDGVVVYSVVVDGVDLAALRRLRSGDTGLLRYDLRTSPVSEPRE